MAVPKLRFKEFDADYTNTTFEKLKGFSIQSGKSEEKGDTGEFPFYGSTGVIGYKDIFDYEGKSILIARVGANAGSLYQIDGKYSVSDNTLRLTVSDDTSLDYLRELLIKFNLNRLVFGTGQPLVTGGMIKKVNIFIPEFTEQTKIASFLSNVDEKISQLNQKHELLSQYKQGMMQKLFSQQLRFKADDGSEFGEWENISVKEIFDVTRGQVLAVSNTVSVADTDYKYPVFSSQTKQKGLMGFYKKYLFEDALTWTTDGANAGDVNFRKGKFYCTNVCGVLLSKKGYANLCIAEILNKVTHKYVSYVGNPKLMNNVMSEIPITIPSNLEEQTKIANFLSAIDQKLEVVAQQIEQAKQWKKGLLQQMFI
nr:restriction endonuclease subunit S [Acinetobacter indicus]